MHSFKRWTEVMLYKDIADISQGMAKSGQIQGLDKALAGANIPSAFQISMLYLMPRLQKVTFSEWLFRNTFYLADTVMAFRETSLKYASATTENDKKLKANEELNNWLSLQNWWFGQMLSIFNLANAELMFHIERLVASKQL